MGLREIRVKNVAVIADATAAFEDGFVAVTGETGSGKSVFLAALRAVLAGRFDSSSIRSDADTAFVSAVFDDVPEAIRERLRDLGIVVDELITLSREITPKRSVHRVNGSLVPASVIHEIAAATVDITSQGVSDRVYRRDWQRAFLDSAGGDTVARVKQELRTLVKARSSAAEAVAHARETQSADARSLQRARDVIEDLAPLNLEQDEKDALLKERSALRYSHEIAGAACGLHRSIQGDDTSLGTGDLLSRALAETAGARIHSPEIERLHSEGEQILATMRDLARDALRVGENTASDPLRLSEIEARLDSVARVERRFGSIEAALHELALAQSIVERSADPDKGLALALQELETATAALCEIAQRLHDMRGRTARTLEKTVTQNVRSLNLPNARFKIELSQSVDDDGIAIGGRTVACGPEGIDDVEFRFSTNQDALPMPLGKGPSGGEISRLVLAMGAVTAESAATLVFDEVDTGVGGETAAKVGEMLANTGERRQVIAITHRAEIAARAGSHLRVTKTEDDGATVSAIETVAGGDRVVEMARLLSGRQTAAAKARARELLHEGGQREAL